MSRQTGSIRSIAPNKGFGFIRPDDESGDVFFHYSALPASVSIDTLRAGDRVSFEARQSDKGPRAERVQLLDA